MTPIRGKIAALACPLLTPKVNGTATLSISTPSMTTFNIKTLSIRGLYVKLS
jgi:hypothetical protein